MIEIYNEDCLTAMKRYPDGFRRNLRETDSFGESASQRDSTQAFSSRKGKNLAVASGSYFDLAIVDPPYGINVTQSFTSKAGKSHGNCKAVCRDYGDKHWDSEIPSPEYFKELLRVSKNQIIFGGNYFSHLLPRSTHWLIWDKLNDYDGLNFSHAELAWTSFDYTSVRVIRHRQSGFITDSKDKSRIHPCQKPVELYAYILNKYAKTGDKILETHLGSGSIAIACHDLGIDLVAYEIDTDYYNAALQRLEKHKKQPQGFTLKRLQPLRLNRKAMQERLF